MIQKLMLKEIIKKNILPILRKDYKIIYLDYPIHFNIGDLAIYHGTEQFFKDCDIEIFERFNIHNISYSRIHEIIKKYRKVQFIWHGWGNMGDTYFQKAELKRRSFIQEFKEYEILFFPQSIYYKEERNLKSSLQFYNSKKVFLFVRDQESFDLINQNYPKANNFLCPDMAYCLEGSNFLNAFKSRKIIVEKIIISRIDEEKMDLQIGKNSSVEVTDWLLMTGFFTKIIGYAIAASLKFLSLFGLNSYFLTHLWYKTSKKLLAKGFEKLAPYSIIETDRLHGFIMSNLLNKKVITSDNYYGKIKNYRTTWNV